VAREAGAEVIAVDVADDKIELAQSLGAGRVVNASTTNAVKELRSLGGAHVAVVTASTKAAYDAAFSSLRRAGTLVVVGMPSEPLTFPAIALGETRILSSAVGTRKDLAEVLDLAAAGRIKCRVQTRGLDEVNQVFEEMRAGRITGRAVLGF
jgi:propanol-preferring alcohol dehydrogenase